MVKVKDEVWCLGFIDGGLNPRTLIVIGGHVSGVRYPERKARGKLITPPPRYNSWQLQLYS